MQLNRKSFLFLALMLAGVVAQANEAAVATASLANTVVPASRRPEPNAFIRRKVSGVNDLVAHIKSDPVVMGRFTRHFGMTEQQVVEMVSGLHADTLKEDSVYLVYNTPESGEIRARSIFYKKGTAVFSDALGNPVLKASCANPLVRGTDAQQTVPVGMLASDADLQPVAGEVVGVTDPVDLAAVAPAPVENGALASVAASMPSDVMTTSRSNNSGWLALLPLAALATVRTSDGGDPVCDPKTNPQCVPEPFTMVLMGTGVAGLVARRMRQKKA